jgi:precorrin-2 dehydrogenase/sirohydrochlorin ferrochelatase
MSLFPFFLKLESRRCLVVGAGRIAESKIASLTHAGALVKVVAPEALPQIVAEAKAGRITWLQREFVESDVDGFLLVIAATNTPAVNQLVAATARERGILVNSVDDPPNCDFYYGSVVERGDLQVAISTAGKSPALAQRLREEISRLLPEDMGEWLDRLGETRLDILETFPSTEGRRQLLHQLAQREHCDPSNCPVEKTLNQLAPRRGKEGA